MGVRDTDTCLLPGTARLRAAPGVRGQRGGSGLLCVARRLRAVCTSTASSGLISTRHLTWGLVPTLVLSPSSKQLLPTQSGEMRLTLLRCGCSLMGCTSLASARRGTWLSRRGEGSVRDVSRTTRRASRPRRAGGGDAVTVMGTGVKVDFTRGALLDRARLFGSPREASLVGGGALPP